MYATHWRDYVPSLGDRISARFGDTRDALGSTVDYGSRALAHGWDASRDLARDVADRSRQLARSTGDRMGDHPLEAALIVGLASFALGWFAAVTLRRARTNKATATKTPKAKSRLPRKRTRTTRSTST